MRKRFAEILYEYMKVNDKIYLLVGDVGWGVLDKIKNTFSKRFINCGVAEQNMIGMACGLAHSGKIPFVYTITSFLLYRPFEFIRNDVDYDKANIKLIGCGRDKDYGNAGFSHWCCDDHKIMSLLPNILAIWPEDKKKLNEIIEGMIIHNGPCYLNLTRK